MRTAYGRRYLHLGLLPPRSIGAAFQTPDTVFQIGVSPRRIAILTTIEGVDFEEAWPGRMTFEIEGLTVPVIAQKHLIANKRALGRQQDLLDIERLLDEGS